MLLYVSWADPACLSMLSKSFSQMHSWAFLAWRQDETTEALAALFTGLQLHLSAPSHTEAALTNMRIICKDFRPRSLMQFFSSRFCCASLVSSTSSLQLSPPWVQCGHIFMFPYIKGASVSVFIHHRRPSIPEPGTKSAWCGIRFSIIWDQGQDMYSDYWNKWPLTLQIAFRKISLQMIIW